MNNWQYLNKMKYLINRRLVPIPDGKKILYNCKCGKVQGFLIGKHWVVKFCDCEKNGFIVKTYNGKIDDFNIHTIGLLK